MESTSSSQLYAASSLNKNISERWERQGNQLQLQQEGILQTSSAIPSNFIKESDGNNGSYDLGELDEALFFYLEGHGYHHPLAAHRQSSSVIKPPTLNIFPSQPMHADSPQEKAAMVGGSSKVGSESVLPSHDRNLPSRGTCIQLGFDSPASSVTKRSSDQAMELASPRTDQTSGRGVEKDVKKDGNRKGPTSSSDQEGPKTPDAKTLRRLAQNREAARKSRLRKKAYIQQLESSRIKLTQLEQDLQKARAQGLFLGGGVLGEQGLPNGNTNLSADAALFDMEYARWVEDHHRLMCELRAAVHEHLPENELRLYVDNCLAHYDEVMNLKAMLVKSDVFHLLSGMWKTAAERCFMWMGGFRPSELLKILVPHIEPLTEQQFLGLCSLQQSSQLAEDALSQGIESLYKSLSHTVASGSLSSTANMANYMGQMAIAMNKLSNVEDFIVQADRLRQETMHQLPRLLTVRQAARCFLAIGEYFHRLRALSSLWLARPKQE